MAGAVGSPDTLYEYFGGNLPSLQERAEIAASYGIFGYRGTYEQNVLFLSILKKIEADSIDKIGFSVVTNYKTTLSTSMTSSQVTVPVSSVTTKDDHTLTMDDLNDKAYFVIEPGRNKEEIVLCTTLSGTIWGTCTRGLAFYGTSTVSVAANKKTHSSGSTVVMSNVHYIYDELVDKDAAETIAGIKTFTSIPLIPTTAPTADAQAASKKYVDDTAVAGAPDATETVKGNSELATQAEMAIGTDTGGTSANLVLWNKYANETSTATTTIPITGTDGKLDQGFIDLTEDFTFSGTTTLSGTAVISGESSVATTTFSVIPILPASDPTTDNQTTRKLYVDTQISTKSALTSIGTSTSLIIDNGSQTSFTDIDVSSIVGTSSTILFLKAFMSEAALLTVRRNGETATFAVAASAGGYVNSAGFASGNESAYLITSTDENGIFEYKVSGGACDIYLLNYIN